MPEFYRTTIAKFYLQQLAKTKSAKGAMLATREKFTGRNGEKIGRMSVYRYVAEWRRQLARAARRPVRRIWP